MSNATTRAGTEADLPSIREWLFAEGAELGGFGFHNNWGIIESGTREGKLHVLELPGGEVVAFCVDADIGPDILEVHPAYRGIRYGEELMRHVLSLHSGAVIIECANDSLEYWRRLGFQEMDRGYSTHAYIVLDRRNALGDGPRVPVTVRLYEEQRKWNPDTAPFAEYEMEAEQQPDGSLLLPQRVVCFHPEMYSQAKDIVGEVVVAGRVLYEDKVKYPEAEALGFEYDNGNHRLDRIFLPD